MARIVVVTVQATVAATVAATALPTAVEATVELTSLVMVCSKELIGLLRENVDGWNARKTAIFSQITTVHEHYFIWPQKVVAPVNVIFSLLQRRVKERIVEASNADVFIVL